MECGNALALQSCSYLGFDNIGAKSHGVLHFSLKSTGKNKFQKLSSSYSRLEMASTRRRYVSLDISSSYKNFSALESEHSHAFIDDEYTLLKKKSQEVAPNLNGRCIYLVGMMGSGKTTVGKILAEVLGYSFCDSDKLVEQAVGQISVAQIFREQSEAFFRDHETKALQNLSSKQNLIVATGGGAVIRPINWKYMRQGITVWLDVPLDALAKRIAAVGTDSRPLLHNESGDAYSKAFIRLTKLFEERGEAYASADAIVSLQQIVAKKGFGDVSNLTPSDIATEALVQIERYLQKFASCARNFQ